MAHRATELHRLVVLIRFVIDDELRQPLLPLRFGLRPIDASRAVGLCGDEERIVHLLGRHRLHVHAAELRWLPLGRVVRLILVAETTAELVWLGVADPPHELLRVVAAPHELARQQREQLGMTRRTVRPHVIDRRREALAEEVTPDTIDESCGQLRLIALRHQASERRATIRLRPGIDIVAVKARIGDAHQAGLSLEVNRPTGIARDEVRVRDEILPRARVARVTRDAGGLTEETVQLPKGGLLRLAERIVVALIALQLLAEEDTRGDGRRG